MFKLHPRLKADTIEIGTFELCRVLLMNDSQFPWVILVPEVHAVEEIYQLPKSQRQQLHLESDFVAQSLMSFYKGDKLNIGALGNLVPQLHIHHIVRDKNDALWPQPVWGNIQAKPYCAEQLEKTQQRLQQQFNKPSLNFQSSYKKSG